MAYLKKKNSPVFKLKAIKQQAPQKVCFIISCHDKVVELLAHLDVISFYHAPHDVIVVHSGPQQIKHLVAPCHYCRIEPKGHSLGALLALTKGMRVAKEKGYKYVCFRNGDDWVLNHRRVECVFNRMKEGGYKLAGYNWFGKNNYEEYALNELYIDLGLVNDLDLDFWDKEFSNKVQTNCEKYFAAMIKTVVTNKEVFKLSDRERSDGVGMAFSRHPYEKNNRWFNSEWQLIGSHDDNERRIYWDKIKSLVPYSDMLSKKKYFKCWLDRVQIF